MPLEGGLAILSGHLDFDLSQIGLDELMAHRTEPQLQRMQTRYRTLTGELLTLREVAQRHGQSVDECLAHRRRYSGSPSCTVPSG